MSNYTYFGAVCVLLGVSLMSFHMQIQDHIDRLIPCGKRPQLLPVKTENIDSTWKEVLSLGKNHNQSGYLMRWY